MQEREGALIFNWFQVHLFVAWGAMRLWCQEEQVWWPTLREGAVKSCQCNANLTEGRAIYRALQYLPPGAPALHKAGESTLGHSGCEGQTLGLGSSCSVLPLPLAWGGQKRRWGPSEGQIQVVRSTALWTTVGSLLSMFLPL